MIPCLFFACLLGVANQLCVCVVLCVFSCVQLGNGYMLARFETRAKELKPDMGVLVGL